MFKLAFVINVCKCPWLQLRRGSSKSSLKTFSQKKKHYGDLFPDNLLSKKQKTPDVMYMVNDETARKIDTFLDPFFKQSPCDTVLEMNPGIGLFTRKLLDREEQFKKILLMEGNAFFMNNLQELHSLYPERVKVKNADLTYVWKQLYQDGLDNGSRVVELLRDVPIKPHSDEPNMIIFGTVGSFAFFKHLINSIIFQNSFTSLGRTEMYFALPPPTYLHLTCSSEIGYMFYRSTSILFQILFEYQFITRLPREHFLPEQTLYNAEKGSKLGRVLSIDPEYMYLVRMIPRRNIFDFVAREDLPALWYFIKQNNVSRRNRIIPSLEKWIPGCGPRLIIRSEEREAAKPLYPDENVSELPKYSSQCRTISNHDFYHNMNIYTQFGDMSPSQMLTLFSVFRKWPEYKDSSFLASFESTMLKLSTSAEESVDGIADEDDETHTELVTFAEEPEKSLNENTSLDPSRIKSPRKPKKHKNT